MNPNYLDFIQEPSKSGYTPNVQVTTGTYCVTMFSSQSSGRPYSDNPNLKVDYQIKK